jgi:hypothetical protein
MRHKNYWRKKQKTTTKLNPNSYFFVHITTSLGSFNKKKTLRQKREREKNITESIETNITTSTFALKSPVVCYTVKILQHVRKKKNVFFFFCAVNSQRKINRKKCNSS